MTKYKNNTHQIGTIYDKIQLQLNNDYEYFMDNKNIHENIMKNKDDIINKNIIVINKSKNIDRGKDNCKIKKNLYISTQYFPPKKMMLFSNSTTRSANIRLSTNPNNDNNDNKLNKNLILNKNANIVSTKILKKSNNNTIEAKNDVNFEELIKSSHKKTTRNERYNNYNSSDNENDLLVKNRTYNSKKNISINDSIFGNVMNHSNNEYQNKNNDLNKNIKVLNRSNNNSSSFSNSNSNSAAYNKKKPREPDDGFQKNYKEDKDFKHTISVTQKDNNNIFKKLNKNSKSQLLFFYDNNSNKNLKENEDRNTKVKSFIEKRKNNFASSHSTIIVKKPKNTSPIIFSTKHNNNKNRITIDINDNNLNNPIDKDKSDISLNDKNIRRANSYITNNKVLNATNNVNDNSNKNNNEEISNQLREINYRIIPNKTKEEIIESLKKELIQVIDEMKFKNNSNNKNINENKYKKILEEILKVQNYEDSLDKLKIKHFDNNDFFIGIMDKDNKYPLKGIFLSHHGDYYNGSFKEGKKDGFGSIIYKNGTRYEGDFKNDRHHGYGKLIQLDGEIFRGDWKNGKINGTGIRLHSNGDKYIGSYVNNIRNGQGHYIFINGDSYNGNWVNGKANGKGTFKFRNGNIYEGEFKDNIILGEGILTMKNGDIYKGYFKNGFINGKGTFIKNNGEKYVGHFEDGKKNGEGKLYDKNGKMIKEGFWKKDIFIDNK